MVLWHSRKSDKMVAWKSLGSGFDGTIQSHSKNSAHPFFFSFALKTVKSRVLDTLRGSKAVKLL